MKISVFTSKKPTGKKLSLNNGELVKGKLAPFAAGKFETVDIAATKAGLKSLLAIKQDPHKALAMGIHEKETSGTITTQAHEVPGDSFARSNDHFKFAKGPGFFPADIDSYTEEQAPDCVSYDTLPDALGALTRALGVTEDDLFGLFAGSTSCGIHAGDKLLSEDNGWHGLIAVTDASAIPRALELLHIRECIAGRGYIRLCTNGVLLTRSIFDQMLRPPCQLVYCGADVGDGLTQKVKSKVLAKGEPLDLEKLVPPLTLAEQEAWTHTETRMKAVFTKEHAKLITDTVTASDEVTAKAEGVDVTVIRDRRERLAGGRWELLPEDNIINANDEVFSVMDVFERPDDFLGKYFKDPFQPDYGNQKMLIREDTRGDGAIGYVALIFSNNRGLAVLRPPVSYVYEKITKGMNTEDKLTPADKAGNTDMLPKNWRSVAGLLPEDKREILAQKLKAVMVGKIDFFRVGGSCADGAGSDTKDPNKLDLDHEGRLYIFCSPANNNSAVDETYKFLASKGRFFKNISNDVTLVTKQLSDDTEEEEEQDPMQSPVRGEQLATLPLERGIMRAAVQRHVQYWEEETDRQGFAYKEYIDIKQSMESDLINTVGKSLPLLKGLATSPMLTNDGFVTTDGYDRATGMYLLMTKKLKATVPADEDCTLEAAADAYRWLHDVALQDCNFKEDWAKAALIACMLMLVARVLLRGNFPILMINAGRAGQGKTEITDLLQSLTGVEAAPAAYTSDETELAKVIAASAKSGCSAFRFDNVNSTEVNSDTLARMSTNAKPEGIRELGASRMIPIESVPCIMNGNGIEPHDDFLRRTMYVNLLDPTPKAQRARASLRAWCSVEANTLKALTHLQTLIRFGQLVADEDHPDHHLFALVREVQRPLESYETFTKLIGAPIMLAAGMVDSPKEEGYMDLDMDKAKEADVTRYHEDNVARDPSTLSRGLAMKILLGIFGGEPFRAMHISNKLLSDFAGTTQFSNMAVRVDVNVDNAVWRMGQLGLDPDLVEVTDDVLAGLCYAVQKNPDNYRKSKQVMSKIMVGKALGAMRNAGVEVGGFVLTQQEKAGTWTFRAPDGWSYLQEKRWKRGVCEKIRAA